MAEQETRGSWTRTERREIVQDYRQSGLSQRVFCQQWGIAPSTLRNWCRRLGEEGRAEPASVAAPRLLAVQLERGEANKAEAGLCLVAGCGLRIEVRRDFDPGTLQRLLAAVEGLA